ncbi:MAG: tripartite tricarboxylate transporter permease, partial [Alphaproteobacteria bacterium]|nr:tripartite tricarboxylate transporter permease [Alphaproteobacteria bacterium]
LVAAATASFAGGTISVALFTLAAPPLAEVALAFGPPEEFTLMLLAFATFIGLGSDDIPKTLFSIMLGLALSAVGLDIVSGKPRLIFFDLPGFYHGVNFLVLAIGIYGIGEMLWVIEQSKGDMVLSKAQVSVRRILDSIRGLKSAIRTMLMGSFLGYFVGILPAAGATPGSLMAYGVAKTMDKEPETFGKGNVKGVVAPEAANNAASTGSMLPMLTLGIPGSPTTAILLGGMVIWGLEPGPRLFVDHKDFVWGLIASLYAANLFALLINIAFIPAFIAVLRMPFTILAPVIYVLCVVGGYAPTKDMHDVWLILIFGVVAYLMRKLDYPLAPAVLAIVLGPLAEASMRQSLIMNQGSFDIFVLRPISGSILAVAVLLLVWPAWKAFLRRRATRSSA